MYACLLLFAYTDIFCRPDDSNLASRCTEHVFNEEKKRQTGKSGFMKAEKCVTARLTQCCTGESKHTPTKCQLFILPIIAWLTSWHDASVSITCGSVHAHVHCRLPVSFNYALQTGYWTPELFWPPLPMCAILVSGLHVEVYKPRSPGRIPSPLWRSALGFK